MPQVVAWFTSSVQPWPWRCTSALILAPAVARFICAQRQGIATMKSDCFRVRRSCASPRDAYMYTEWQGASRLEDVMFRVNNKGNTLRRTQTNKTRENKGGGVIQTSAGGQKKSACGGLFIKIEYLRGSKSAAGDFF